MKLGHLFSKDTKLMISGAANYDIRVGKVSPHTKIAWGGGHCLLQQSGGMFL